MGKKGLASLINKKISAVLGDLSFLYRKRRILPSPDDLLLLPDAFWGQDPAYIDSIFLAKEAGWGKNYFGSPRSHSIRLSEFV